MKNILLFLTFILFVNSLKIKKECEPSKPTIFHVRINEHPCCPKREETVPDIIEPPTEEEEEDKPLPNPEPEPDEPDEPEPIPDPCPNSPIKGGRYNILTKENADFTLDYSHEKVSLGRSEEHSRSQRFNIMLNDNCQYIIQNGDDILQPNMFCYEKELPPEPKEKIPFDLLFLIDSTNSMSGTIKAVQDYSKKISKELKNKLENMDIKFGAVYYQDPVLKNGTTTSFDFTDDMNEFQKYIEEREAYGGADQPEDWYSAYLEAKKLTWRDGIKLIVHIGDAPAHGINYCGKKYTTIEKQQSKLDELAVHFCDIDKLYIKALKIYNEKADAGQSWQRMQDLCIQHRLANGNPNNDFIDVKDFDQDNTDTSYFTDMIIESAEEAIKKSEKVCYWGIGKLDSELNLGSVGWDILKAEDGEYRIVSAGNSNLIAQVKDGMFEEGNEIIMAGAEEIKYNNDRFVFYPVN